MSAADADPTAEDANVGESAASPFAARHYYKLALGSGDLADKK